jgi:hypothetical protein
LAEDPEGVIAALVKAGAGVNTSPAVIDEVASPLKEASRTVPTTPPR